MGTSLNRANLLKREGVQFNIYFMDCKICNKKYDSLMSLSKHVRMLHKLSLLKYKIDYDGFKIPLCSCSKPCKIRRGIIFNATCGYKECYTNLKKTIFLSDETKKKISISRKKWLKDNSEKHVWKRNDKFLSIPCEYLKTILKDNKIPFIEEYTPIESDRNFSIDIALIHDKIGIEVNGNQHYEKNGELKCYYKERTYHLNSIGWKIIQIPYYNVYKKEIIDILINDLKIKNIEEVNKIYEKYNISLFKKKFFNCISCNREKKNKSLLCIKCSNYNNRKIKERPDINILIEDIKNLGYCGTGRKYNVSDNAIRKWIKNKE